MQILGPDLDGTRAPLGHLARHLAAHRADLTLQVAQARLAGVLGDYLADGVVSEADVFRLEAVFLHLARYQVAAGDLQFLLLRVTGKVDDLHTVAQGRRHRVDLVGRGNEHDIGETERHVDVVVGERVVLLRVQHLQKRR